MLVFRDGNLAVPPEGLVFRDLRIGSQPWPFPNSLMIGFTTEYADGELEVDPTEIEDAGWYEAGEFPPLPPKVSIARAMIDAFVAQHGHG